MKCYHWMVTAVAALAIVACGSPAASNPTTTAADATSPAATDTTASTAVTAPTTSSANANDVVASLDDVVLTRGQVDEQIGRRIAAMQITSQSQQTSPLDMEKQIVSLFVQQELTLSLAKQKDISVSEAEIDTQIDSFRTSITANGGEMESVIVSQLGFSGSDSTEFRQFASFFVAQDKLAETLVPSDTLRQQLTEQYQDAEVIDVAHILVNTEDEAKQVIERLDNGEDFAALAKELSTDPGSKDNGGEYKNIGRGEFIEEFEKVAFDELEPGEYTKTPVQSQFGYHVIKLISRGKMSQEAIDEKISTQLDQQLLNQRQVALQQALEEERTAALAAGRLVEPTYPDPTAVPTEPVPTEPATEGTPEATATP